MTANEANSSPSVARRYGLAALFGVAFGFLLQKGGVAKFHILVGVLLFEDFTVIKVMMSAVLTGMLGAYALHRLGKIEWNRKQLRLGPNIVGGLVFGGGFACSGYCPGTGAAALGQMNWDALFVVAGLVAGSYVFALASAKLERSVQQWGRRDAVLLPELVKARFGPFLVGFALLLTFALLALAHYAT